MLASMRDRLRLGFALALAVLAAGCAACPGCPKSAAEARLPARVDLHENPPER
jgi:hypothetical protein